mmetsp:Transcript_87571/g.131350  ORF Transcript_87571/g.131350 Transcript_87571/m.131350 type:complete len:97 (+) Transcript_87571:3-293(+)
MVDFPSVNDWKALEKEMEVDPVADHVRPGAQVRVKPTVSLPARGWGPYNHASHGEVVAVRQNGVVTVRFAKRMRGRFNLNELELTSEVNRYNSGSN